MATTSVKSTPRDAQVMAAILKEMGIVEYEPRVINQMLEFTYRMYVFSFIYIDCILFVINYIDVYVVNNVM